MRANIKNLAPNDWPTTRPEGEETLWLVDFVAPYGGTDEALKDLKENIFGGATFKSLIPGSDGASRVMEL
jgi:hemolysin-activating ACP:hemolysin acyltransferase